MYVDLSLRDECRMEYGVKQSTQTKEIHLFEHSVRHISKVETTVWSLLAISDVVPLCSQVMGNCEIGKKKPRRTLKGVVGADRNQDHRRSGTGHNVK